MLDLQFDKNPYGRLRSEPDGDECEPLLLELMINRRIMERKIEEKVTGT